VQRGSFGPAIEYGYLNQYVFWSLLGVLYEDVKVSIFSECVGIEKFKFRVVSIATLVGFY
jgi:hypothetical protein